MQTFTPEHPSVSLAVSHNFLKFAEGELLQRREHNYPPYQRLVRLIVRSKEMQAASDVADAWPGRFASLWKRVAGGGRRAAGKKLRGLPPPTTRHPPPRLVPDFRLLGPAEAEVFRLKGYYRYHFQPQSPSSVYLHEILRRVLPVVKLPKGVELSVDVDPQDML